MSFTVRSALIQQYGPAEVLEFDYQTVPHPGEGQAFVRNTAIGLNFVDVYYRRGTYPVPGFPAVLGNEAAGVVEAVGAGVSDIRVGDRVVYSDDTRGAYTTGRLYPADRLTRLPDDISDDQAASSFLKGLTARMLLKEAVRLQPGDTVLYHAAAGGVGQILAPWAKALGLNVIGTVSTPEKAALALRAGYDAVINYNQEDFVGRTFDLTDGRGVNAVFDSVGKDTFAGSLACLTTRGALVPFGQASGAPPLLDPVALASRALQVCWPVLPRYVETAAALAGAAADLFEAIRTLKVRVEPARAYRFDDIVEAHRDLEARRTTGSAVLRI